MSNKRFIALLIIFVLTLFSFLITTAVAKPTQTKQTKQSPANSSCCTEGDRSDDWPTTN
jgi:hypothetical protein